MNRPEMDRWTWILFAATFAAVALLMAATE